MLQDPEEVNAFLFSASACMKFLGLLNLQAHAKQLLPTHTRLTKWFLYKLLALPVFETVNRMEQRSSAWLR